MKPIQSMSPSQLATELSCAERAAAKASHLAANAKDTDESLNADALKAERYVSEVRKLAWPYAYKPAPKSL